MNKELTTLICWSRHSDFPEWLIGTDVFLSLKMDFYSERLASPKEKAEWFLHSFPLEMTSGFVLKWMREVHKIFIYIERESIGSDEWVFAFGCEYLPIENWEDKRRAASFVQFYSFMLGFETYSGGWDTYEEALEKGLQYGMSLIHNQTKPVNQ